MSIAGKRLTSRAGLEPTYAWIAEQMRLGATVS